MTVIGVDLGAKGGWQALDDGIPVANGTGVASMAGYVCNYLNEPPIIYVEEPLPNRRGTNVSALTSMHRHYGYFKGYADAQRIETFSISYHEWSRVMLNGGKYPAAIRCRELWPDNPEIAAHEGLADAALIAEYGRLLLEKSGDI